MVNLKYIGIVLAAVLLLFAGCSPAEDPMEDPAGGEPMPEGGEPMPEEDVMPEEEPMEDPAGGEPMPPME